MFLRSLLTSILITCSVCVMAATEVVPLNFRTSDELLSVAKSFLGQDGQVSAYNNQLIVNAEPRKIDELSRRQVASWDASFHWCALRASSPGMRASRRFHDPLLSGAP